MIVPVPWDTTLVHPFTPFRQKRRRGKARKDGRQGRDGEASRAIAVAYPSYPHGERFSALGQFQAAAAQIEAFGVISRTGAMKHVRMQAIDNKSSLFFILHQAGMAQDAEMVRNVDDLRIEKGGQFADIAGAATQAVNDPQPLRVRQSTQNTGATIRLQWLVHSTHPSDGFHSP